VKIILINLRYFISGGPERYMFNVKELLELNGHEVIPFSIQHNSNIDTKYASYFLDKMGEGDETYFSEYKKNNLKDVIHLIGRLFYSFEAKRKLSKLIVDTNPDLVYILYFENKISPSIIDAAKNKNVPVVLRISDFGMICATNIFYLKKNQTICEKCLQKGRYNLVLNKCYHDSYFYSVLKYSSYILHDLLQIQSKVDAFVIPSEFTKSKFIEFGIPKDKIFRIPTFFNFKKKLDNIKYLDFALYIGRIDADKGIRTLVDAFINTDYQLKIIGFSSTGYTEFIQEYLVGKKHNISFLGKMDFEDIIPYLQECCFTIVSSEWYDNFPNAILESFAFKKPVIATSIGSLKELVDNEKTGLLFKYGDSKDLQRKVVELFANKDKAVQYGNNGFDKINMEFSKDTHYKNLINLFNSLT
jgi:glycosyltransferase involved in cell wall biosynthesis